MPPDDSSEGLWLLLRGNYILLVGWRVGDIVGDID